MSGNYFCHVCGGLVDLIKLQPSDVRLCECEKRFARLRAENNRLKAENKLYAAEMSAAKENGFYSAQELFMAYQNAEEELAEAKQDADRFVALATEMLQKGDGCVWMRLEHLADRHDKEGTTPSINEMREAIDAAMKGK